MMTRCFRYQIFCPVAQLEFLTCAALNLCGAGEAASPLCASTCLSKTQDGALPGPDQTNFTHCLSLTVIVVSRGNGEWRQEKPVGMKPCPCRVLSSAVTQALSLNAFPHNPLLLAHCLAQGSSPHAPLISLFPASLLQPLPLC